MGQCYPFGDVYHVCKCPVCNRLLDWKATDVGIWSAECCWNKFELYCETASIARVGSITAMRTEVRNRRVEYGKLTPEQRGARQIETGEEDEIDSTEAVQHLRELSGSPT